MIDGEVATTDRAGWPQRGVIPFLAADSRCLHPAFPRARSQCSKDPGAPLGHLRRYGVPAKKKKKKKRLLCESLRLGKSVYCSAWPTRALWLVSPWGLAPVSPGWDNSVAGGQEKAAGLEGQLPELWACRGEEGRAWDKPKNPDPHLPVHIDPEGRVSVPRLHWVMWLINDSSLPDPPVRILITLRFLVTLSIGSPFHP